MSFDASHIASYIRERHLKTGGNDNYDYHYEQRLKKTIEDCVNSGGTFLVKETMGPPAIEFIYGGIREDKPVDTLTLITTREE